MGGGFKPFWTEKYLYSPILDFTAYTLILLVKITASLTHFSVEHNNKLYSLRTYHILNWLLFLTPWNRYHFYPIVREGPREVKHIIDSCRTKIQTWGPLAHRLSLLTEPLLSLMTIPAVCGIPRLVMVARFEPQNLSFPATVALQAKWATLRK